MCKRASALTQTEARKHRNGICITPFCTTAPKRYKTGKVPLRCSACCRREWAEKNPEKYLYANLRGNARRRGKVFDISFEAFTAFLTRENYLRRKRGRTKTSVSVDRDRNELGYIEGNLRAITIQANSVKRNYVDYFRMLEQNYLTSSS
jgi:hypothetical protein